jgi:hypothetical protein
MRVLVQTANSASSQARAWARNLARAASSGAGLSLLLPQPASAAAQAALYLLFKVPPRLLANSGDSGCSRASRSRIASARPNDARASSGWPVLVWMSPMMWWVLARSLWYSIRS